MEISQLGVLFLFVYSFFGGVLLGVTNDVVRAVGYLLFSRDNETVSKGKAMSLLYRVYTVLWDVFIPIFGAAIIIVIAYSENSGIVRWLIPTGMIAGILIYRSTAGKIVKRLLGAIAKIIRKIIKGLCVVTAHPFVMIKKKIKKKKSDKSRKGGENGKRGKKQRKLRKKHLGGKAQRDNNNRGDQPAAGLLDNHVRVKAGKI